MPDNKVQYRISTFHTPPWEGAIGIERVNGDGLIQPVVAWVTQGGGRELAAQIVKVLNHG